MMLEGGHKRFSLFSTDESNPGYLVRWVLVGFVATFCACTVLGIVGSLLAAAIFGEEFTWGSFRFDVVAAISSMVSGLVACVWVVDNY